MGPATMIRVIPLAVLLAGCAVGSVASKAPKPARPVVLVDNQGTCPLKVGARPSSEDTCRWSREYRSNGVSDNFVLPRVPWGIAYAYNCKGKGDFYAVVGVPNDDGLLPETQFYRSAPRGRGYVMETGKGIVSLDTMPKYLRIWEDIEILSSCHWHVRAVVGKAAVVARYVPALPSPG